MDKYKEIVTATTLTLLSVFLIYKISIGLQPYLILQSEIVKSLNIHESKINELQNIVSKNNNKQGK